jgi:ABC-type lipoprotein release transport system permease subunit
MPDDALGPRSLLRGADGKGLLPLIPARLADAIIALAEAFTRSQQATVSIPVTQIAAYVVATALAGVLAAIAPARRAARLNILEAIAAE